VARRERREGFAEKRERLGAVDEPSVVLDAALRFLEPRQRSIGEVRRRLTRVGYREDLVTAAIDRLIELGMLDDEAFARAWIESRDRVRPRGSRALMSELAKKGIDRQTADQSLSEREEDHPGADADAAEKLLNRNARSLARVADPRARRQRAYALLARNGFDPEIAAAASRALDGRDGMADDGLEEA
jgi:regulatory protein